VASTLGLPPVAADETVSRLGAAGFLKLVEEDGRPAYLPARPPERIPVADIVATFREGHLESGQVDAAAPAEVHLAAAEEALLKVFFGVSLADLIRRE